jgi:hypothetical protein
MEEKALQQTRRETDAQARSPNCGTRAFGTAHEKLAEADTIAFCGHSTG